MTILPIFSVTRLMKDFRGEDAYITTPVHAADADDARRRLGASENETIDRWSPGQAIADEFEGTMTFEVDFGAASTRVRLSRRHLQAYREEYGDSHGVVDLAQVAEWRAVRKLYFSDAYVHRDGVGRAFLATPGHGGGTELHQQLRVSVVAQ
jgi:hypothetical protein